MVVKAASRARRPTLAPTARGRLRVGRWLRDGVVVGWFAVLVLAPTAALVRQVFAGGWGPFARALADPEVQRAFGLTLGITALATALNVVFGVVFALVLERQRFWGRSLADGLVDLPFAAPPVVAGLMLVVLYGPEGWLGAGFEAAGLPIIHAVPGMVLATAFVTLPFVVREVAPMLREFGTDQIEAAYTLGAGRLRTFRRVTFPVIRWGLAYGAALTAARSLGEFGALLVVSGNLVGQTQTATLYVHDGTESFRPEGAYAVSLVLAVASFALLAGVDRARARVAAREKGQQ